MPFIINLLPLFCPFYWPSRSPAEDEVTVIKYFRANPYKFIGCIKHERKKRETAFPFGVTFVLFLLSFFNVKLIQSEQINYLSLLLVREVTAN